MHTSAFFRPDPPGNGCFSTLPAGGAQAVLVNHDMANPDLATRRLYLRPVRPADLETICALGADERVMATLGGVRDRAKMKGWLEKQIAHWERSGFGRFIAMNGRVFVGVVGLMHTDFDAAFTPAVEVVWMLAFDQWGKGYATEAARVVIDDGVTRLHLREIIAITATINGRSRRVMERLGMVHAPLETFAHPNVAEGDPLREHVLYRWSPPRP